MKTFTREEGLSFEIAGGGQQRDVATLQGHRGAVMSLAADAKHLYSGSVDRSVRVWEVAGLRQLRALFLPEMHAPVYGLAIARGTHAEGAQLLSASHDVRVCHSSRDALAPAARPCDRPPSRRAPEEHTWARTSLQQSTCCSRPMFGPERR